MDINIESLKEQLSEFLKNNPPYNPNNCLPSNFKGFTSDSWRTGGITGGNCWGGVADTPVNSDTEENITTLDDFLKQFYPTTSFLTYHKILSKIKYHEYSYNEYYGNYTTYKIKSISLDDIINAFNEPY